jgi:hypothetical protein
MIAMLAARAERPIGSDREADVEQWLGVVSLGTSLDEDY